MTFGLLKRRGQECWAGSRLGAHPLIPVPVMTMFISPAAHLGKHSRRGKIICQLNGWNRSKYAASIKLAAYRKVRNNLYHIINLIWLPGLGFLLLYSTSVFSMAFLEWIFFTAFSGTFNPTVMLPIAWSKKYLLLEKTDSMKEDPLWFWELLLSHLPSSSAKTMEVYLIIPWQWDPSSALNRINRWRKCPVWLLAWYFLHV